MSTLVLDQPIALSKRPRLGFLGVGWIGRHRLEAIARSGMADITAISDVSTDTMRDAQVCAPNARTVPRVEELFEQDLDGLVIATPSILHAAQASRALDRGFAVFCQKPLGRNADETRRVVQSARTADRLLSVDLSYRFIPGMIAIRDLIMAGELGDVFGVNLVFHNAYGPNKSWFYDRSQSGGGCLLDLGIHLIDLALWSLNWPAVDVDAANLFAGGRPLCDESSVEDYATAQLQTERGAAVQIACSWKLPAGCDAVIEVSFYGTRGGARLHNVNGSFFDFVAERFHGTRRETLSSPDDCWFGQAAVAWTEQLTKDNHYDPQADHFVDSAKVIDEIYALGMSTCRTSGPESE
jgi:predicted dehydrogenase